MSLTAPYMGEKILNPVVKGGRYDTAGYAPEPELPIAPDNLDAAGFREFVSRPEYQEVKQAREKARKQNQAKRKRLRAIQRGENINMRRDRLAGDPRIMG